MNKELYDKYKVTLDDNFRRDMVEAAVATYGEKYRKRFEEVSKRILVHTKINIKDLMDKLGVRNPNDKEQTSRKTLDDDFSNLFGKETLDEIVKQELIDINELGEIEQTAVNEYVDKEKELDGQGQSKEELQRQTSSYQILLEECKDYNLIFENDNNNEFLLSEMNKTGSFVVALGKKENPLETAEHIFIGLYKEQSDTLAKLAHEMLHSFERKVMPDASKLEGFSEVTGFDGKIDGVDTKLLSECCHTYNLNNNIIPYLQQCGYDIKDDVNDYGLLTLNGCKSFFETFQQSILEARCGDIQVLFDVVGKDNFLKLNELQNMTKYGYPDGMNREMAEEQARQIFEQMKEYSRDRLGTRIGKMTVPMQKDIKGKEEASKDINDLILNRTRDESEVEIDD